MSTTKDSSDSDSGSLPDLRDVFPSSPPKTHVSSGDIVFAKFKHLYWPALVRAVYPKQKKVTIWYCDEPGKTFKLPLKNVCLFHDEEMKEKIQNDVIKAGVIKEHDGLTTHAKRYLIRRSQGKNDDPLKFFDQTYPFFLAEQMLKKDPNADVENIKIRPLYISNEKKESIRTVSVRKIMSDDSEVESTDSESTPEAKPVKDYIARVNVKLQEKPADPCKEEFVDAILDCVLSGKVDDYLQKIKNRSIPSEHQKIYEQSEKHHKRYFGNVTYTGPIEDDSKLREIIFYLLPLYEKMSSTGRSTRSAAKKCKKAITAYNVFNEQSAGAQYVASVWLPESIIYSISLVKEVSIKEAKKIFNEMSETKTKAVQSILQSLDADFWGNGEKTSTSAEDNVAPGSNEKEQNKRVKHCCESENYSSS